MKLRTIKVPELKCPTDKKGNYLLNEYILGVDVARSSKQSNNKTAIVVIKLIRNKAGRIRQAQIVNIITPPNGLNFEEQSITVKKIFYSYGGNLDLNKSRVKAVIIDSNSIGQGLLEKLLEDVTDPETNEELGCWATINTEDKPKVKDAPKIVYGLKAQGINASIIRTFIDYVESGKLKLIKQWKDVKDEISGKTDTDEQLAYEIATKQTQALIDQVANLKIKETKSISSNITVEQVVRGIDKDIYSAIVYGLYYVAVFLDEEEEGQDYNWKDYLMW
ncbi:MAG: hypothetical protein GY714_23525 [Desulfobacterales bacterium]|nr:hypothetical protein [Desulfobacterales bacterium]